MNTITRVRRHLRIIRKSYAAAPDPSFLVLFINSVCNMKCDHCFYWRSLNAREQDLTVEELFQLSNSLGRIENLNISGGEPFIRREFSDICRLFVRQNGVKEIYVPTNGYFTERTVKAVRETLDAAELQLLVIELSLDGMPAFHDAFRGTRNAFRNAMATYEALTVLQAADARLRIHATSTATDLNMDEIRRLTTYLYDRCPGMDHHNLAIIRGDRKNPSLQGPRLQEYEQLYDYIRRLWQPRELERYGALVEPMLQWAKVKTVRERRQVVPCTAGRLSAVVYANGDVAVCEQRPPIGNLRTRSFPQIWRSAEARAERASVKRKECHCSTEVFMWPSITYRPRQLVKAMVGAQVWRRPAALHEAERVNPAGESDAALRALDYSRGGAGSAVSAELLP
jgi:MoaA/NifB/PqqE/SkfB family radical SAM enzyme